MGYTIGTKRSSCCFYVGWGRQIDSPIQRLVFCFSPIDALSYLTLEQTALGKAPQQKTIYLVSDSNKSISVILLKDIPEVIAAYDNAKAGNLRSKGYSTIAATDYYKTVHRKGLESEVVGNDTLS